jgi:hypothetical protein
LDILLPELDILDWQEWACVAGAIETLVNLRWAQKLGGRQNLAKPAATVQLSFSRSSGCAKNILSHTHKAAM